ncbi:pinin-like isoform X2 [Pseudochaenichthys georgianus]|uniref:pinin-like isoform X2 n=1 Tax=Pseudochaenichthys georgianus TaxID=52239 RepID=UPI00146D7459|nr:uncharacterized protein LOC117457320 isoform X2 [Pseudochaenichthys georgianus]
MSQTFDVNMEPLQWPIAPDGYIPNSVIRSWSRNGKAINITGYLDDIFDSLQHCTTNDEEDESTRVFWLADDEEEEEEEEKEEEEEEIKTDDVKQRGKEKEDKKNEKGKVERHERAYENKEREEKYKKDGFDLLKPSYDILTTLQNQQITSDEGQMNVEPQRQEVRSTYNSRKTVEKILLTCHDNGPKQLGEKREDFKLQETITAPLQYVSVPFREKTSSFISKEALKLPEPSVMCPVVSAESAVVSPVAVISKQGPTETLKLPRPSLMSPVVSPVAVISKQEPRITLNKPPTEPQNLTPHPLKPTPPTLEDPRPQPELGSPECPPIRDESFRPLTSRCKNVRDVVHLDRKALELFKKSKYGNKNLSHPGKYSTKTERLSASKGTDSPVQTNTGGLYRRPEFWSKMSTIPTHPPSVSCLEGPSDQLFSDLSLQFEQTNLPNKKQKGNISKPEWRKTLYQRIALQGFSSPQGARLAAKEHTVKPSNASQPATIIPSLQPGQAAAHQRVVQKVQMKDTREPAYFKDHYVIPMNSQQSFFTSNLSGKTQYGRLQFDWLSGHDEEKLLCGCG